MDENGDKLASLVVSGKFMKKKKDIYSNFPG